MNTVLQVLPPADYINANHRLHFHAKNQRTQAWRTAAKVAALAWASEKYERAHIQVAYRFPTNHRREVANLQPTSKALVDGLVDAGLLPDDDDRHVIGPDNRREWPNGPERITITITPLEDQP
jgi:Holliday junction resolvase RusA-like endonuclease